MPGTIILKPLKANILNDNHQFLKMDPYCSVHLGSQEAISKVCKNGGKTPSWEDSLIIRRGYEPYCTLQIKDNEFFKSDSTVGEAQIDLGEIESTGRLTKWYKLGKNNEVAGEVLIEAVFAADSAGSYKPLPQQQSYSQLASSHKTYNQNLYPPNIYSPGKQSALGLNRPVYQMPMQEIYGYHNPDQQITYPHISHNLSSEEYSKMHARNIERYQPTNKIVPDPKMPPTWEGYRTPEHLMPNVEPPKVEEPESKEVQQPTGDSDEKIVSKGPDQELEKVEKPRGDKDEKIVENVTQTGTRSVTSLDNFSEARDSTGDRILNATSTPVSKRREEIPDVQKSPGVMSYYPMIGGVTYRPKVNEASYQPMYWENSRSNMMGKQEMAKNVRKSSGNSLENGSKTSTEGSLGAVGGTSLNVV